LQDIYFVGQSNQSVCVVLEINVVGSYRLGRQAGSQTEAVFEGDPFTELSWASGYLYFLTDPCVAPGATTYRLCAEYDGDWWQADTKNIVVVESGAECDPEADACAALGYVPGEYSPPPEDKSDDDDDDGGCSCTTTPGNGYHAAMFGAMLAVGLLAGLAGRRRRS
jgi:MYXO-CTERM domain-containing protein